MVKINVRAFKDVTNKYTYARNAIDTYFIKMLLVNVFTSFKHFTYLPTVDGNTITTGKTNKQNDNNEK